MSQNVFPIRGQSEKDAVKADPSELEQCYRLLEVAPEAAPSEIKQVYWDLVKVWHPERFADDPRLQEKAKRKLEQISDAFNCIRSSRKDFSPPVRQRVNHEEKVERGPHNSSVRDEKPIFYRAESSALTKTTGEPLRKRSPRRKGTELSEDSVPRSPHGNILMKAFWGFVIGVIFAIPISGAFFLIFGGLAAVISFNVTWTGVLVYALKRRGEAGNSGHRS
jgi:hypothetical protein